MPVPHFEDKHSGRPYVTPHRLLSYRAGQGRGLGTPPPAVIVGWQTSLLERVRASRHARELVGPAGAVLELSAELGFAKVPIGAPVTGVVLEELASLGVRTVVGVGTAGAIGSGLTVGKTVICSQALRDEGTSHHYEPGGRWAHPDAELFDALRWALPDAAVGPSWTTDAPYRETAEEILAYRSEGVLTVDMEASALFTVGSFLGLRTASVFCVSDVLHGDEWEPQFHSSELEEALWRLFESVESVLLGRDGSA
ncbi:MAG TPA: nucleoside phosphorylase [Acidimicrobiales bacterium]|nr:nucleoside phosphorylase [Acidimicrobiales bacterium]